MAQKSKYKPKDFESSRPNGAFATIALDMVLSPAWQALAKGQQILYVYMKTQYYGAKVHPGGKQEQFYFNKALYEKVFKLYSNDGQFRKDRDALIAHGFIKCVEDNFNARKKSIYEYSTMWRFFGTTSFRILPNDMPASMQRKRSNTSL